MSNAEPAAETSAEQALRRSIAIRIGVAIGALVLVAVLAVSLSSGPQAPGGAAPATVATERIAPASASQPPLAATEPAKDPSPAHADAPNAAAPPDTTPPPAAQTDGKPAEQTAPAPLADGKPPAQDAVPPVAVKPAPASAAGGAAEPATRAGDDVRAKGPVNDAAASPGKPSLAQEPASKTLSSAPGAKPPRGPHLQAGMFMRAANAEAFKAKLEAQGLPVYIESRVHVGPFRDRQEAERVREKLLEMGVTTVLIAQ